MVISQKNRNNWCAWEPSRWPGQHYWWGIGEIELIEGSRGLVRSVVKNGDRCPPSWLPCHSNWNGFQWIVAHLFILTGSTYFWKGSCLSPPYMNMAALASNLWNHRSISPTLRNTCLHRYIWFAITTWPKLLILVRFHLIYTALLWRTS